MEFFYKPWPWYVVGPLIGITVPILLLLGNKKLGISGSLTQICAACIPSSVTSLKFDWQKDGWNILFVIGVLLGGFLGGFVFANPNPVELSPSTIEFFKSHGMNDPKGLMPQELFNWQSLFSAKGFSLMIVGGFLVGFGTRYARGCTSGHGILGLSALHWPSLLATASFFLGGILFCWFVLPYILDL
jgi:uncharacterized membrane protein YedE/YeeE